MNLLTEDLLYWLRPATDCKTETITTNSVDVTWNLRDANITRYSIKYKFTYEKELRNRLSYNKGDERLSR